jgi:hypothetical protein
MSLRTLLALGLAFAWAAPATAQQQTKPGETPCETPRCVEQEDDSTSDALLWVPRAMLRLPRLALDASMRLLVLAAGVEEEHHIAEEVSDLLFNDARTFGVIPTAFYETGFKPSVGVRVIHRDLAGRREGLRLRALFAGLEQQHYEAQAHSGSRLGALKLHASAAYNRFDDLRFYGLGNADAVDTLRGHPPRSAYERSFAVRTRYRREEARGSVGLSRQVTARLALGGTLQLRRRDLSVGDLQDRDSTPWADVIFKPESLTGLSEASTDAYGEAVLGWDDRRATREDVPLALASTGLRVALWGGAQAALDDSRGSFARVGGDVRRYIDLAQGNRVLVLRLRSAWAIGRLRAMPFSDLPSLGGSQLLRGYPSGRFTDRGSVLATVEYRYPVQDNLASYLFIDAGRVVDTLSDLGPSGLGAARVGFGGGLDLFSTGGLMLRLQLASSIDGGLYFNFLLDASDEYERT